MDTDMTLAIELSERGFVPDPLLRLGIRKLVKKRLLDEERRVAPEADPLFWARREALDGLAVSTEAANSQHYEVPAEFFEAVLGPHLKYSSALWEPGTRTLEQAEARMLELTVARAQLADGQRILELGCGWGSLTLFMAERFPRARILAVSNSTSQRRFILDRAKERGLSNVEVRTVDINRFETVQRFDRVVSVEMFEHVQNWERLLTRIQSWLTDDGRLFLHFFAHRRFAYRFERDGNADWMARHFFTGGVMPSVDMLEQLDVPFEVEERHLVSGTHYAQTAEAWLRNLDRNREKVLHLFERETDPRRAKVLLQRWRMFFLACVELFGFRAGEEWKVVHARLAPRVLGSAA